MAENSKIEWTDHTFNPWEGCQKVGPGCDNCYAENRNARFGGGTAVNWGPGAPRRRTSESNWNKPLQWNARHEEFFAVHHRRQRVFCASLADVFDNEVPTEWRSDLFDLIERTPSLDWLLLTKRIGNALRLTADARTHDWLAGQRNVWIGATVCTQEEADRDVPKLLQVPARVRFLSIEPMLGPVDLVKAGALWCHASDGAIVNQAEAGYTDPTIDWVIAGGESGPKARPMHPEWVRSLRDQCQEAGVPFLFKQWGEWKPTEKDRNGCTTIRYEGGISRPLQPQFFEFDDEQGMARIGKKAAGRLLDGKLHDEYPHP